MAPSPLIENVYRAGRHHDEEIFRVKEKTEINFPEVDLL